MGERARKQRELIGWTFRCLGGAGGITVDGPAPNIKLHQAPINNAVWLLVLLRLLLSLRAAAAAVPGAYATRMRKPRNDGLNYDRIAGPTAQRANNQNQGQACMSQRPQQRAARHFVADDNAPKHTCAIIQISCGVGKCAREPFRMHRLTHSPLSSSHFPFLFLAPVYEL